VPSECGTERGMTELGNFHPNRWKCLWNPHRARDTLKPYAVLKIQVQVAKNLLAKDWNLFRSTSDPYYEIMVDDKVYHVSEYLSSTLYPRFNHPPVNIPIWHPNSIVRIALMDWDGMVKRMTHGNEILGFVEFIIRDLPINNSVHGWFELRLEEKLVGTADKRVYEHTYYRDEYAAATKLKRDSAMGSVNSSTTTIQKQMKRSKAKGGSSVVSRLAGMFVDMREEVAFNVRESISSEKHHREPLNAGSVLCDLTLKIENNHTSDEFWAYCLPDPVYKDLPPPMMKGKNVLPELDVAELVNNGVLVGDAIWNNGLLCAIDSVIYILRWKECWISLVFTAAFVLMCLPTDKCPLSQYAMSIFLCTIAFWILILSSRARRNRMVANPLTASFDDEGYALMAQLKSSSTMATWVERVVTKNLHGCLINYSDLEIFASRIFRDGKPVMSFDELINVLRREEPILDSFNPSTKTKPWLKLPEHAYQNKAKVIVSQIGRPKISGQISAQNKDGTYTVIGEDGTRFDAVKESNISDDPTGSVPTVPTWLIPDVLEDAVRSVQPMVNTMRANITGVWGKANHIFTWKSVPLNLFIILVLFGIAAGLVFAKKYVEWLDAAILIGIGGFIFLSNAWWIQLFVRLVTATVRYARYCRKSYMGLRVVYFQNIKMTDDEYAQETKPLIDNQHP